MAATASYAYVAVVPAYNEAATIRDVAERTLRQVPRLIVVDDGSDDATAAALDGLPVTLLRNAVNMGKAASLWRGMQRALELGARAVITLDGDGQHQPEDIPALVATHRVRDDRIVIGSRLHLRDEIPASRYYANRFANFWIALAAGHAIADSQSGFRIYPAELLRRMHVAHDASARFVFESEILIEAGRAGVQSVAVPVTVSYHNLKRASHFSPVLDIARITRMVACKLLLRGMHPRGLVKSLRGAPSREHPEHRGARGGG
jgi:glycosyltransferase involved in cell wall biosynthesis